MFDLLYLLTLPTVLLFALCGSYGLMVAGEQIKKALAKRKSQYIKKKRLNALAGVTVFSPTWWTRK